MKNYLKYIYLITITVLISISINCYLDKPTYKEITNKYIAQSVSKEVMHDGENFYYVNNAEVAIDIAKAIWNSELCSDYIKNITPPYSAILIADSTAWKVTSNKKSNFGRSFILIIRRKDGAILASGI